MRLIIISILLVFNNHLAGQDSPEFTGNDPCSGKIYIKSDQSYRKYPFDKYWDFISYYYSDSSQSQHLTPDKAAINEIKIIGCYPNLILFEDVVNQSDSLAMEILLDTTTIYLDTSMIWNKHISKMTILDFISGKIITGMLLLQMENHMSPKLKVYP